MWGVTSSLQIWLQAIFALVRMCTILVGSEQCLVNAVFTPPETAVSPPWRDLFSTPVFKEELAEVAVDEAHCISEWLRPIVQ